MGNASDPNDPFYKSQPGWVWEPQMGSWINIGGPNAGGPATPPKTDAQKAAEYQQAVAGGTGYGVPKRPGEGLSKPGNTTTQTPIGTVTQENTDPFTGGDLFAPKLYVAKGHDINAGAFAPTDKMAALKALMGKGMTTDATGASLDVGAAERARGAQAGLLQQLLDMAAGRGPSPAQAMMQQAADRNLADAAALTQSQRGLGATAAGSQVAGQRAQIGQELARDMGILRLQEQMQATQAAAGVAQGLRGQDIGQEQARAQVQLAKDNLNASMKQKFIEMGFSAEEADRKAATELQKLQSAQALALAGLNQQEFQRGEEQRRGDFQTFLKSLGGVGDFLMKLVSMGGGAPAK